MLLPNISTLLPLVPLKQTIKLKIARQTSLVATFWPIECLFQGFLANSFTVGETMTKEVYQIFMFFMSSEGKKNNIPRISNQFSELSFSSDSQISKQQNGNPLNKFTLKIRLLTFMDFNMRIQQPLVAKITIESVNNEITFRWILEKKEKTVLKP